MKSRRNFIGKIFQDKINFPYGFSRSGDFSLSEARLLESHGHLCQAICAGEIAELSDEDHQLLRVVAGEITASTTVEKVWVKYLKLANKERVTLRPNKSTMHLAENDIPYRNYA